MTIANRLNRVEVLKQKFTNSVGLPFQGLLPESIIQEALNTEKIKYRQRLFDPFVSEFAGSRATPQTSRHSLGIFITGSGFRQVLCQCC